MQISIAFSPCPNDTFIFDAAVHKKIDTEGLEFVYKLADVEELNLAAEKSMADVTKLSYHAYLYVSENYQLLRAGGALGENNGPLLIAKNAESNLSFQTALIAVPGLKTTANLLFSLAYPKARNKIPMLFSDIESAVLKENVDYGLIIHENRFTYHQKGLKKIADMGEFWKSETGLPVPLGGIVIRRTFDEALKQKVNRVIRRSMEYAYENPESPMAFMRDNAQEMDSDVMQKHIALYVNDFSFNVGTQGGEAVRVLFEKAASAGIASLPRRPYFID